MKNSIAKAAWQSHIDQQKISGKTIREYCQLNDLNFHTFRYYKDRLGSTHKATETTQSSFIELKERQIENSTSKSMTFHLELSFGEVFRCEIKLG